MRRIYKYGPLLVGETVELELPFQSSLIKCDLQSFSSLCVEEEENIFLWAMVWSTSTENTEKRRFRVFATGEDIDDKYEYIDTVVTNHGLVWHICEEF